MSRGEERMEHLAARREQLLWVRHSQSIPKLARALEEFRALYNQRWLIERLGFEPWVQARQRLAFELAT